MERSGRTDVRHRLVEGESRPWLVLLVASRLLATAIAVALLAVDPVDPETFALAGYGLISTAALAASPGLRRSAIAWAADSAIVLGFVLASGDWRSAFYPLWLTTLALPAVHVRLRTAAWLAPAAALVYFGAAFLGGPNPGNFGPLTYETLAIHLILPMVVIAGLAYATETLRSARRERVARERLAIENERRRIAWELHDSAKQRLHAAHLLVSSLQGRVPAELDDLVARSVIELENASAEMDTSLAELQSPLEGRPVHAALAARAEELAVDGGPEIAVDGVAPDLPPLIAAHVFRIGSEALTNAIRHAAARRIELTIRPLGDGLRLVVADDGRGLPTGGRHERTGMVAMQGRAASIGATLDIASGDGAGGTVVTLDLPHPHDQGGTA